MKKCPHCGATLQDDDNYCVYCGKNVHEEPSFEGASEGQNENLCQYCHKPISKNDKFCTSCGMENKGAEEVNVHPHDRENSPFKNYLLYWKGYFNFKGRTSRKGYWDVFWINLVIGLIMGWIFPLIPALNIEFPVDSELFVTIMAEMYGVDPSLLTAEPITYSYNLITDIIWPAITFFPGFAIAVRRLRDTGKPWYSIFINLVPLVGPIIYIVWLIRPSDYFKYNHR